MSAIDRNITQYENWLTKAEEEERDLKNRLADITVQKAIYRSALYTLREMKQKEQKLEKAERKEYTVIEWGGTKTSQML